MKKKYSLFEYKSGASFLHKCPPWCKLIFLPALNILFLFLPGYFSLTLIVLQFLLACLLRFSLREQLRDFKAVFYYALMLFIFQLLGFFLTYILSAKTNSFFSFVDFWTALKNNFSWQNEKASVFMLVKIFALMQSASLFFKTTTSMEIQEGLNKIESGIRKIFHLKKENKISASISMFINFIPMISKIWQEEKRAWLARGGKNNSLKMFKRLLPLLFSVGMKKAYNQTRAILIRK